MRNYRQFLTDHDTATPWLNDRLQTFVAEYLRHRRSLERNLVVLDVGCGLNAVLAAKRHAGDTYHACDFYDSIHVDVDQYWSVDLNAASLADTAPKGVHYDVIYCGEVIEHLFSPDALLRDLRALLAPSGILILSTPNLGYYVNRLLLVFGISPLYLENSAERKIGRKTRWLGQDNPTEGHIRLFTYGAAKDLIAREGFEVVRVTPTITWNFPLDRLVCRFSRSLAPNNVFVLKRGRAGSNRGPR